MSLQISFGCFTLKYELSNPLKCVYFNAVQFDDLLPEKYKNVNLYPENLRKQIDETNEWTYDNVNNGVYKSGFATTQESYEKACNALFEHLDKIEKHLATSEGPYYWGKNITEGDIRLFTTIVRFDVVYVQHFKTNIRDIRSGYPAIHKWLRHLYWNHDAFKSTTEFTHVSWTEFRSAC